MKGLLATCLLLSGCATTSNYKNLLSTWMGHNINEVVQQWGPPSSSFDMPNGNKMYTWYDQGSNVSYAQYNPYLNSAVAVGGNSWCKTTLTADENGTLTNWQFEGNMCRSK